jgi:pimeloyl-ACP methyl ester carboxylesterase
VFSTVTLRDGRTLEFADLGDAGGTPVVFHPGTPAAAGQGAVIAGAAARQGVRLISVSRPGYGASTMCAPSLTAAASDTLELADQLGFEQFGILGSSGGGPFALAVAAVAPGRVSCVAAHASPGEYGAVKPEVLGDDDRRALGLVADGHPDEAIRAMNEVADADLAGLRGLSEEEFSAALAKMAPPGPNWFDEHPDLKRAFEADFQRAVATSDGMTYDNLCWLGPWHIDLSSVTATVRLVYADHDGMTDPAHADWLRDRLASSDLHVVPGGHGDASFGSVEDTLAAMVSGSG